MAARVKSDRRYPRQYGGNGDDWTDLTAVVVAGSGTYTSASGTMRYKRVGNIVVVEFTVTITTKGTGTFPRITNLPHPAKTLGAKGGAVNGGASAFWSAYCGSTTSFSLFRYDGGTTVADGDVFRGSITYETDD